MIKRTATLVIALAFVATALPARSAPLTPASPSSTARRVCAADPAPGHVSCFAWVRTGAAGVAAVTPALPNGFGPTQFHAAYALPTTAPTCPPGTSSSAVSVAPTRRSSAVAAAGGQI